MVKVLGIGAGVTHLYPHKTKKKRVLLFSKHLLIKYETNNTVLLYLIFNAWIMI